METHKIIPATADHAQFIAATIRPADREEMWAACLQTPSDAIRMGMEASDTVLTAMVHDRPVAMWGVVKESLIGNVGTPWMVASFLIDDEARTFLRHCRGPVMELLSQYDTLENHVDARNVRSIQWLRWLGFTIEEPKEYGVFKLPFHKFWMKREANV